MTPLLYPAIDLLEGRAVRLRRGERRTAKAYSEDPVEQTRAFVRDGAKALHVVDLDAAFGEPRQLELVGRMARAAAPVPVQVGGGIRDLAAVQETLEAGASRAILGTVAVENPALAAEAVERVGVERIACGIDVMEGRAATRGWTEARGPNAAALAADLCARGVRWLVVTAVARDGMLEGFDLALLREIARAAPGARIIASGGAGGIDDLYQLASAGIDALAGAIAGTALYEGKFTVRAGQAALERPC